MTSFFLRLGIALAGLFSLLVAVAWLMGFPPAYIASAPAVGTGIGAKLLCSSRYVSQFSAAQSFDDLVQYSPILAQLSIDYDEDERTVTTSLFGLSKTTASYKEGLGCAVDYPNVSARHSINTTSAAHRQAEWPVGNGVTTLDRQVQRLVEELVTQDNIAGLNTRALLVAHRGRVVAEVYDQGATSDTPLLGWSMAKSLTAIMLGNQELRGEIDLQGKPNFAEWENDERQDITIPDLLTMTDGLGFSEQYNPGDDATAMLFTVPSTADYVLSQPLENKPGEHFNYSSGTANLLSRLYFNNAGGNPQANYSSYQENIATVFNFHNAVFETDASGNFVGSSYFYASARDWAKLGQVMLDNGVINGRRVVRESWVELATTPNNSSNEKAYGYQWWLNRGDEKLRWPSLPENTFAAMGNRQQRVMVIPSHDLVIVRLGWTAGPYPDDEHYAKIIAALPE